MSLEPVILNTVNVQASEIKESLGQESASIIENIESSKSHTTDETERTLSALASQTETINSDIATARDAINTVTTDVKDEIKAHTVSESNRVINAMQSGSGYGHSTIVSVSPPAKRSMTYMTPFTVTPPAGCFVRIVTLYAESYNLQLQIDLGYGLVVGSSSDRFSLYRETENNGYRTSLAQVNFRIGGGNLYNNPVSVSTSDDRLIGHNPFTHLDGAIGLPVKLYGTSSSAYYFYIGYEIRKVQ
ncbi:hypothetical protein [Vibrio fluvialis]|uniref:hypothetical protein n=1 Tax=Vibrio fluvialis TaxID=676 RepID=UPI003D7CA5B6